MNLTDTALAETVVEIVEAMRPDISTHHYLRLLSLAEELDARIEDVHDLKAELADARRECADAEADLESRLSDLREIAAAVRREYDLTDNEAAIILINAIEEA